MHLILGPRIVVLTEVYCGFPGPSTKIPYFRPGPVPSAFLNLKHLQSHSTGYYISRTVEETPLNKNKQ